MGFFGLKFEWLMLTLFFLTVGFIGISSGLKCLACDSTKDPECNNPNATNSSGKFSKECGSAGSKFPVDFEQIKELFPVFEGVFKDILGEEMWKKLEPVWNGVKKLLAMLASIFSGGGGGAKEAPMCMMASSANGTVRGCSENLPIPPKGRGGPAEETGSCKNDKKGKGCACSAPGCNDQNIGQKITYNYITFGMSIVIGLVLTTSIII